MRPCHCLNAHKAPNPASRRISDRVAVFQIVLAAGVHQRIAETAAFECSQTVFLAPHPVNVVAVLGADGCIGFQTDIALGFQKDKHVIVVPLDGLPVLSSIVVSN